MQGDSQLFSDADIITGIRPPSEEIVPKLAGKTLISMIQPAINTELYNNLVEQNTNVFALDCVPRMLSRGQSYDILSSQANIAGYRAVIEAAEAFPRFFAGQMTAAGKVPPAKVLVLGAGVAGLAAIQTARNMGAIVRAFDVRPVTKEQVESMGATFLTVDIEEDGSGSGSFMPRQGERERQLWTILETDAEGWVRAEIPRPERPGDWMLQATALTAEALGEASLRIEQSEAPRALLIAPGPGQPGDRSRPALRLFNPGEQPVSADSN